MGSVEAPIHFETIEGGLHESVARVVSFKPDLIIEGATGSRPVLKNLLKAASYGGPYIGLDINMEIIEPGAFTRYGNCAKPESVFPIIQEFSSKAPVLSTWNALPAILSNRIGPEDRKDPEDVLSTKTIVQNLTQLFPYQMHVFYKDFYPMLENFFKLSVASGWQLFLYDEDSEQMVVVMMRK
ncbi:hypothetical protein A2363_02390 [Candidatus Gottesmanbacteria bacterium RIFOXYB1_FULL_47_11]|uniref:Uncharacterized protein n=1 Tax=Candidatus Gottesmanbacteria bacterium RIFOXYB1_FULL_47_11 TaxID=1798401 RepID=A0A1F6BER4_9BACT|nr:MAG: hypothetical protein A2363_02390 [Candidatus Gottesmanbacteria bacterium RIFOXYB1_FULL_47_11]